MSMQLTLISSERLVVDRRWGNGGATVYNDPFSRLYYLRAGYGELLASTEVIPLVAGRLYLIPAYSQYRYRCLTPMDLSYMHLSARLGGLGHLHQFVQWPVDIIPVDLQWVEERIDLILRKGVRDAFLMKDGALRQLLALFEAASDPAPALLSGAGRFAPVLRYVQEHYARPIRLSELARLVHLQPNYFSDLFRRHFGEAPSRYVQRHRIERAAERLAISDVALKELADDLGFTDAFHFSRTFKALMGVAPSRYRERILRDG